jgi:hypothetical protein
MQSLGSHQVILGNNKSNSINSSISNLSDSRPSSSDMSVSASEDVRSARSSAEPSSNGSSQRRISMDEQPERHIAVATVADSRPLHSERGSIPHHRVVYLDNVSFSIDVESIFSQSRFSFKETNRPSRDLKL